MTDEQDPVLRRKIQNRNAQRRFRNRTKANNEVVVFQQFATPYSTPPTFPMTPITSEDISRSTSSGSVLEADSLNLACDTWPTAIWPISPIGDASSDTPPGDLWNDQDTNYQIDSSAHYNPSQAQQILPQSVSEPEVSGLLQSPWLMPELSLTLETPGSRPQSAIACSNSSRNQLHSKSSCGDKANLKGCCVAHRAEDMIAEVQELYMFGVRFGLLSSPDDSIPESLEGLRAKLLGMAQCATVCR